MIWFCRKTDCKTDHYNRAEPLIVTAANVHIISSTLNFLTASVADDGIVRLH